MKLLMLVFLSGCLYVSTSGEGGDSYITGIRYECRYHQDHVWKTQDVCGPIPEDPDYVLERFKPGLVDYYLPNITCTASPTPCLFNPDDQELGVNTEGR